MALVRPAYLPCRRRTETALECMRTHSGICCACYGCCYPDAIKRQSKHSLILALKNVAEFGFNFRNSLTRRVLSTRLHTISGKIFFKVTDVLSSLFTDATCSISCAHQQYVPLYHYCWRHETYELKIQVDVRHRWPTRDEARPVATDSLKIT